jgi:arylsulfatase A-like enzyme
MILLLMLALAGCAADPETGGPPGAAAEPAPPVDAARRRAAPPVSQRDLLVAHRPLLDEVDRAELRAGGLLIDFGSADQHKYTRGGWASGWGPSREAANAAAGTREDARAAGHATWAELAGRRAWLDLATAGEARAVVVRARSRVPGQTLAIHAGDRQLGVVKLSATWAVARAEVAAGALPDGPLRLELRRARSAKGVPAAEIDWLWLDEGSADPPAPGPRVAPLAFGGTVRRAIAVPSPRTYSFYLVPPPGASLVTDVGVAGSATFAISATADGSAPVELLRETVSGAWRERRVALDRFAGVPIRLDLTTSQQRGEAGWGEPEIALVKNSPAAAPPPAAAGGPPPRNLVFIMIDTARADVFGPFGGKDRVARTPHYDRLARGSTVFVNAYNNENWTKPSVATLLSGLYPSTHDTKRDASALPAGVELLSQRLEREGFATGAFIANGYISDKFGFKRGWKQYRNYIREGRPSEAEHVYGDALAWLERRRKSRAPFFVYIQTIDPHVRYKVDEKYWGLYFKGHYTGPLGSSIAADDQIALTRKKIRPDERNLAWLRALYHGEVSYHDDHMGRFLDQLERLGLRERTMVVITNDHGEELGERGGFGHGHQLHEEMIRAPLLISYPPVFPPGARVDEIVEHVDLAPTLLDAMERPPLSRADGESMLPLLRGRPLQRPRYAIVEFLDGERAIRVGDHKMMVGSGGAAELYDLRADPGERRDLGSRRPIARRMCQVHLGEGLAVPDKAARVGGVGGRAGFRAGTADIDPVVRRQLEALGYFGGGPNPAGAKTADRSKDDGAASNEK